MGNVHEDWGENYVSHRVVVGDESLASVQNVRLKTCSHGSYCFLSMLLEDGSIKG